MSEESTVVDNGEAREGTNGQSDQAPHDQDYYFEDSLVTFLVCNLRRSCPNALTNAVITGWTTSLQSPPLLPHT